MQKSNEHFPHHLLINFELKSDVWIRLFSGCLIKCFDDPVKCWLLVFSNADDWFFPAHFYLTSSGFCKSVETDISHCSSVRWSYPLVPARGMLCLVEEIYLRLFWLHCVPLQLVLLQLEACQIFQAVPSSPLVFILANNYTCFDEGDKKLVYSYLKAQ